MLKGIFGTRIEEMIKNEQSQKMDRKLKIDEKYYRKETIDVEV